MRLAAGAALVALALPVAGCGEPDTASPADAAGDVGAGDAGGDASDAAWCTHPGDHGNDIGVGEYCTPTGHECEQFPLAALCLAAVGQTPWMCTRIMCDGATNCGEGAGCFVTDKGSACVPCRCSVHAIGCGDAGEAADGAAGDAG